MENEKQTSTIQPDEALKMFGLEMPEHITFNPLLTKETGAQYEIIRQSVHDGTLIFEKELIGRVMENLVNKSSFCKNDDMEGFKDIKYEVGLMTIETVFGIVDLPAGRYPGETQTASIPVRCELLK